MFISHFVRELAASPSDLLFAKALLCAVSVVKANYNHEGVATNHELYKRCLLSLVPGL